MRLVEARIEGFGQYRDQVISFAPGLNVIHGTNESGKTTLMKFIEGVLYGFYKPSQRRQYTEDYEKYRPWDGGSYAGTLIYENAGRTIAVYRDFAGEEIRMYDWETKEDLTGQLTYNGVIRQVDPASRDWKISPAAFRNTISIVQGKACPDLEQIGGELQESLMNLTTAGDEDISVRTSLRTLRRQMEEIEGDGASGGTLNELAARENELKERLRQSRELQRRQERIRTELAELPEEAEDPEQADLLVERAGRPEQKEHLRQMEQEIVKLREQERQIRTGAQGNEKQYEELNPLLFHISKDGKTAREIDLSALASPNGEKNKDLAVAFIPLSDGRYLVNSLSDDTLEKGLVFAESTDTVVKKMSNRIRGNAISSIQTGNDFLCYVAYQGNEDLVTVEVQDYNGKNKYSLDCSAACDNGTASYANCHFALGVWEDEILLVSKKGVFRAEYGDKAFTKVTDFKTDNIYYLTLDRYQIAKQWTSMWVTGENSFYVLLSPTEEGKTTDYKIGYYTKGK